MWSIKTLGNVRKYFGNINRLVYVVIHKERCLTTCLKTYSFLIQTNIEDSLLFIHSFIHSHTKYWGSALH